MTIARILVVGSANVDFTVAAPRLPSPGETVTDGTLLVNHGGKGANQAVAARRLGADVRLIGCVGGDAAGAAIRAALAGEGIGVDGVAVREQGDAGSAARRLREAGARTVIITLGKDGALAYGAETDQVPAFTVRVVDTTAAGDAFNAGLAVALAERRTLREALRFASAAAALTCTRRGAQASLPARAEVERLLQP